MAITIKGIPTLKDKSAKDFVKKAETATNQKATVDFRKQYKSSVSILKKAKI